MTCFIRPLFTFLLLMGTISPSAFAETRPPEPGKILSEAAVDFASLLSITSDLKRFIPRMRSKEEIYPYLHMLPELERVAAKYDVVTLGVDPVKELSLLLTRDAVRWIEIDRDSPEIVEIFLTRAEDATRYTMASQQVKRLNPIDDRDRLLVWHAAVNRCLLLVRKLNAHVSVVEKFEELQGRTVRMILPVAKDLSEATLETFFHSVQGETAIEEVMDYLHDRSLASETEEESARVVRWTLAIAETIKAQGDKVRFEMRIYPGKVLLLLVGNKLGRAETLAPGEVGPFVDTLVASQLGELGDLLVRMYEDRSIPDAQVEFLWDLSSRLMKKFDDKKMFQDTVDFEPFYKKLAALHATLGGRFEGTYKINVGTGKDKRPATLVIASVGASNFIMGMNIPYGSTVPNEGLIYNFFDVIYDLDNDQYVGQYRAVESPRFLHRAEMHHHVKFKLLRDVTGSYRVEGTVYLGGIPAYEIFSGDQVETFPSYSMIKGKPVKDFTGTFYTEALGEDGPVWLVLTKTGTSVGGTLRFQKVRTWIPFEWGYFNPHRNAVYLSSGELKSEKWVSLRGQFSEDGKTLTLTRIVGGIGMRNKNVVFRRLE